MFYSESENKYVQVGSQFELGGVTYPPQWLYQATPEQKAAIGLEEVAIVGARKDDRYYWVSTELDKATMIYVNTPKDLDTVKQNSITQVNQTAHSILYPSDWMVVKAVETATQVPAEWSAWRETIRQIAADTKVQITAALDVDGVANIVQGLQWPPSPNQVNQST